MMSKHSLSLLEGVNDKSETPLLLVKKGVSYYKSFTETLRFMQLYHAQSRKNIVFASVYIFEYTPVYTNDNKMLDYIVTAERVDARY